jgi:thioredoxin reductase
MSFDCDVLVVGAGIAGSSTAYALTQRNVGKVVLIEQFDFLHKSLNHFLNLQKMVLLMETQEFTDKPILYNFTLTCVLNPWNFGKKLKKKVK